MNRDELFKALKSESEASWGNLVAEAIAEGVGLDEIRDMLDYVENARQSHNATKREKNSNCKWLNCFQRRTP